MATTAQVSSSRRRSSAGPLFSRLIVVGVALLAVGWAFSTYKQLVRADQEVRARWTQVQTVYQRRAELVPNLVEAVRAAPAFEAEPFTELAQARAQVSENSGARLQNALGDLKAFQRFQTAQQALSTSLQQLLADAGANPELQSAERFRDLQSQLEGVENRVSIERMRFNEASRQFNLLRNALPTMLIARGFGDRFDEKPAFAPSPSPARQPSVRF
ncbi:MAG: LemA family protein [Archangium sp.]|nr:LemA family protein [Archangium sp.]